MSASGPTILMWKTYYFDCLINQFKKLKLNKTDKKNWSNKVAYQGQHIHIFKFFIYFIIDGSTASSSFIGQWNVVWSIVIEGKFYWRIYMMTVFWLSGITYTFVHDRLVVSVCSLHHNFFYQFYLISIFFYLFFLSQKIFSLPNNKNVDIKS
jgi:hypothetical protein